MSTSSKWKTPSRATGIYFAGYDGRDLATLDFFRDRRPDRRASPCPRVGTRPRACPMSAGGSGCAWCWARASPNAPLAATASSGASDGPSAAALATAPARRWACTPSAQQEREPFGCGTSRSGGSMGSCRWRRRHCWSVPCRPAKVKDMAEWEQMVAHQRPADVPAPLWRRRLHPPRPERECGRTARRQAAGRTGRRGHCGKRDVKIGAGTLDEICMLSSVAEYHSPAQEYYLRWGKELVRRGDPDACRMVRNAMLRDAGLDG